MAKVIILCGKIASGKTTYAERLHRQKGAMILSCDDLMLRLFDSCLGDKHDETARRCSLFLYGQAEQLVQIGVDCVLDFGYWTRKEREEAKAYFAKRGIACELHYLKLAEEERIRRLDKRNQRLAGATHRVYRIEGELLKRLDKKFEPPLPDEIDKELSV